MPISDEALAGLRVVELSDTIAGAYCGKLLAGFGAEVIKVEPPAGDAVRRRGPFAGDAIDADTGGLHFHLDAGKKSVTLDVTVPTGATLLRRLLQQADVLIETCNPGRPSELGFGYDDVVADSSRLVYASVTPFGQTGPYRDYQGNSAIVLALSGLSYTTGERDREPLTTGGDVAEYLAGEHAALAVVAALMQRALTGQGQYLDVSMLEAIVMADEYNLTLYQATGAVRTRFHSAGILGDHVGLVPCSDGYVMFQTGAAGFPTGVPLLLGRPDLARDPFFSTARERLDRLDDFKELLRSVFSEMTREEVVTRAQQLRMPFSPLLHVDELLRNRHLHERGFFTQVDQPGAGSVTQPGAPVRMSATPFTTNPAPALGAQRDEVFVDGLGLDAAELVFLRSMGVA